MRCAILLALLLGAGCTHVQVSGSSNTGASSVTSGAAGVQVQGGAALAAVVVAGMIVSAAMQDLRSERPYTTTPTFSEWMRGQPAPELAPDRSISEQDCTRPLDYSLGNIRCK